MTSEFGAMHTLEAGYQVVGEESGNEVAQTVELLADTAACKLDDVYWQRCIALTSAHVPGQGRRSDPTHKLLRTSL
ncbi:hypothetical protein BP5796_00641 [Coleophoma crateriformis]|uniref:Uncharacterized protein n=1 Tax=Coleophoma crateriformis TaxID=565419 RepID=A0A3D8TA58_9HELO|nr:hypothetical protein BP5796_00641 [Coleophoma crateriformis]